jgi:cyclopropane fatty-acyl-phospholipid synthase-like methyltransferase
VGFFDTEDGVQRYVDMVDGCDGRLLVDKLSGYLSSGSSVLELGMGPGKDLVLLGKRYRATGSDSSKIFLDRFRAIERDVDLLLLDAVTIDTDRRFDCIFSNKVLHHLVREDLERSIDRQKEVLTDGGVVAHSFWFGSGVEEHEGLLFTYYTESDLKDIFGDDFKILTMERYEELEPDDSVFVVLRKK